MKPLKSISSQEDYELVFRARNSSVYQRATTLALATCRPSRHARDSKKDKAEFNVTDRKKWKGQKVVDFVM